MDGFEDHYWNLIQALGWVYRRDPEWVRRASDGVTDHGTYPQEMQLPDGRVELIETPSGPPSELTLEITAVYRGDAAYPTLEDAEGALLAASRSGRPKVLGLENNEGNLLEIPLVHWAGLKFYFDPPRAAPLNITRAGATHWYDLKFPRSEVLEIWPNPLEGSVNEQSQPQGLETEHQRKGGRVSKFHRGVQVFVDRLSDNLAADELSLTLGRLESWLTENAPPKEGYDPQPEIPDFADVEYDEETLWWKDDRGQARSLKKRALEPYIARAKSRDRGSPS